MTWQNSAITITTLLPIVGALFRNRFATTSNQELILFVTPRII